MTATGEIGKMPGHVAGTATVPRQTWMRFSFNVLEVGRPGVKISWMITTVKTMPHVSMNLLLS